MFVFFVMAIICFPSVLAALLMAAQVVAAAKSAKGGSKEGVPVIVFGGSSATASTVCLSATPPITWAVAMSAARGLFETGMKRQFIVNAYAAQFLAWRKGWPLVITMPERIRPEDLAVWKSVDSSITEKMVWESLLYHELHHAHCFREREFALWASLDELFSEEVEAYEITFRMLGLDLSDPRVEKAVLHSASVSVDLSGASAYLK